MEKLNKEEKEKKEDKNKDNDDFAGYIKDGVEVVDVKAVPRDKQEKPKVDKFGIPIPNKRTTWDKI